MITVGVVGNLDGEIYLPADCLRSPGRFSSLGTNVVLTTQRNAAGNFAHPALTRLSARSILDFSSSGLDRGCKAGRLCFSFCVYLLLLCCQHGVYLFREHVYKKQGSSAV